MNNIRDSAYDRYIPHIIKTILITIDKPGFLQIYGLINGFNDGMLGIISSINLIMENHYAHDFFYKTPIMRPLYAL